LNKDFPFGVCLVKRRKSQKGKITKPTKNLWEEILTLKELKA
jgi:hypothetical protein